MSIDKILEIALLNNESTPKVNSESMTVPIVTTMVDD